MDGEPGAVPIIGNGSEPENFVNMMQQVFETLHKQQVAAFM